MDVSLVASSHPLLSTNLEKFDFTNPPIPPHELATILVTKLMEYNGLGLSANQLGLPYRAFAMVGAPPFCIFNPRIVDVGDTQVLMEEGCLSFPNLSINIKRSKTIKVRYEDFDGNVHTEKFSGLTARIFQHELDHLNGIVYTSRANKIHLDRAMRQKKVHDRFEKHDRFIRSV